METSKEAKIIDAVPNLLYTSDVFYPILCFLLFLGDDDMFAPQHYITASTNTVFIQFCYPTTPIL